MGKLIYQKCLVSIPSHGSVVWVKIITFLLSFNGDRSFFLSDEDFVGSVNSGRWFLSTIENLEIAELAVCAVSTTNFFRTSVRYINSG